MSRRTFLKRCGLAGLGFAAPIGWRSMLGVAEESSESVTLVKGIGLREVIPWQEIASFKTTPKSLMQEGLESGLSPTDFRSLVEYLQSVDPPAE